MSLKILSMAVYISIDKVVFQTSRRKRCYIDGRKILYLIKSERFDIVRFDAKNHLFIPFVLRNLKLLKRRIKNQNTLKVTLVLETLHRPCQKGFKLDINSLIRE